MSLLFSVQVSSYNKTVPVGKTQLFLNSYIYLCWHAHIYQKLLPLGKSSLKGRYVSSLKQKTQVHSQVWGNDASADLQ